MIRLQKLSKLVGNAGPLSNDGYLNEMIMRMLKHMDGHFSKVVRIFHKLRGFFQKLRGFFQMLRGILTKFHKDFQ